MMVTLQRDKQYGDFGPRTGDTLELLEIRKVDGEYWGYAKRGEHDLYLVLIDDLLTWNTENTTSYGSTRP